MTNEIKVGNYIELIELSTINYNINMCIQCIYMKPILPEDLIFYRSLLKYKQRLNNGYKVILHNYKTYKVHRIIAQLKYKVKLDMWEHVHHIDGNKLNNLKNNLKIMSAEEHISLHHAGQLKKSNTHNKLSKRKINDIIELSKIFIKNNKPYYSKISKITKVSDTTVRKYLAP